MDERYTVLPLWIFPVLTTKDVYNYIRIPIPIPSPSSNLHTREICCGNNWMVTVLGINTSVPCYVSLRDDSGRQLSVCSKTGMIILSIPFFWSYPCCLWFCTVISLVAPYSDFFTQPSITFNIYLRLQLCEQFGLLHESRGQGKERFIEVRKVREDNSRPVTEENQSLDHATPSQAIALGMA